jgi:hypothetical protein
MEYTVVVGEVTENPNNNLHGKALAKKVNDLIADGWEVHGSPFGIPDRRAPAKRLVGQAMVKN